MEKYILGENSPIEQKLEKEGKIRKIGNYFYEFKNKFFKNGRGDLAMKGEKFTVKEGYPYRHNN